MRRATPLAGRTSRRYRRHIWRLALVWKLLARSGVNAGEILQRLAGVKVQREREQQKKKKKRNRLLAGAVEQVEGAQRVLVGRRQDEHALVR